MRPAAGLLFALIILADWPLAAVAAGTSGCLDQPALTAQIDCLGREAVAAHDVNVCLSAQEAALRWACVARYADHAGDAKICEVLTDAENVPAAVSRDLCRTQLAFSWRRGELCDQMHTPGLADACYLEFVRTGGDAAYCERIKKPELKATCGPADN